ncbi:UNVERIFIED_CONTAM: hypothetical protein O8I53_08495 [Campylobacter lari]
MDALNVLAGENRFKFIHQKASDSIIPQNLIDKGQFGRAQQEQVAIIYDSKNFELINFKDKDFASVSFNEPITY